MGGRICVVAAGEVAVVGADNGVLFALLHVRSIPLTNARSAGVCQHKATDVLEILDEAVAFNGGTNLLASGSDCELF